MLARSIADIGLTKLAGSRPVHVDVTREFLLAVRPLPFTPDRVILELAADQRVDELLLHALKEARDAGFQIALDGFAGDGATRPCSTLPTASSSTSPASTRKRSSTRSTWRAAAACT